MYSIGSDGRTLFRARSAPILSPKKDGMYYTNLYIKNGEYEVHVGDNMVRYYIQETLPDFIKAKIAIINVLNTGPPWDRMSTELDEVGWKRSITPSKDELWYVIVMTKEELWGLRGEENNDAGRQGKEKS